jgi:hypothetical protein
MAPAFQDRCPPQRARPHPRRIRGAGDRLPADHQRSAGLKGDTGKARPGRLIDRLDADTGQIHASFLPRFDDLHKHAAADRGTGGDLGEQPCRAAHTFPSHDLGTHHHHALPPILPTQFTGGTDADLNRRPAQLIGRVRADRTQRHQ